MSLSRRDFIVSSALSAIGAAIARPALGAWQTPPTQPPAAAQVPSMPAAVFTPIRRNVGFFTMRGGTIGYLIDPAAVAVVDSMYAAEGKACLDGLNSRSSNRPVDVLINSHHHDDHSFGNISFKGAAKKIVSHARAAELMRTRPGLTPKPENVEQLFPDTTFTDSWSTDAGAEKIRAKHYGPAHTSGDVVVTFERANVAHMGDLMFNQRHPLVDRAGGASIKNWITVLERTPRDHSNDTIYIFGHANVGLPVTGAAAELKRFRDYLEAVLTFVGAQIKAGKSRDEILAMRDPLKGFETFGRFPAAGPRDPLTVAYEELTA
jgi:glyoxylase-like metal-dependent hydrolase (beta-lactamase superfamily II)